MTRYRQPELCSRLASDYLTGGMSLAARRRFEALLQTEPALALALQTWRKRLDDGLLRREPPARAWDGILARVQPDTGTPVPQRLEKGWAKRTWMGLALSFGVLTASLMVSLVMLLQQPGPGAPSAAQMAAVLKGPDGHSAVLTVHNSRLVLTAVGPVATPGNKSFELWMLPKQGKPQAVGLVQLRSSVTLQLPAPALLALSQAKGFAISVEPAGGSPTGQPTGPITYVGDVVAMTRLQPGRAHLAPGQGGGDFYE